MSDTTIVAVVILGGVFLVMLAAIFKSGIDGALKLWNVMGALTGVAFGGITSFYFQQQQISQLKTDNQILSSSLEKAAFNASEATRMVSSIQTALKGEVNTDETSLRLSDFIPKNEKEELTKRLTQTSTRLSYIADLPKKGETKKSIDNSNAEPESKRSNLIRANTPSSPTAQ